MNPKASGWLGRSLDSSRCKVGVQGPGYRVLFGTRAGELTTLFAFAAAEAGANVVVLDVDGPISSQTHGCFRAYDHRSLLHEASRIEGEDATHGQLVASAYATALDLTASRNNGGNPVAVNKDDKLTSNKALLAAPHPALEECTRFAYAKQDDGGSH